MSASPTPPRTSPSQQNQRGVRQPDLHVCFVCSGNICRSPTAALVYAEHLRRAGLANEVRVSSAGVGGWHVGEPADPRAAKVLADNDYPTEHRAAKLGPQHNDADLFVAMDSGHYHELVGLLDGSRDRVRMFRSFDTSVSDGATASEVDVPDPYYGGDRGFVDMLAMIEAAMPGLLAWTRNRLGG